MPAFECVADNPAALMRVTKGHTLLLDAVGDYTTVNHAGDFFLGHQTIACVVEATFVMHSHERSYQSTYGPGRCFREFRDDICHLHQLCSETTSDLGVQPRHRNNTICPQRSARLLS